MHQLPRAVNLILPYDISCQKYTPHAYTMIKSRFHEIDYSFAMWEDAEFLEKVRFDSLPLASLLTGCGDIVDSAASLTWRLRRERKAATTGLISLEGLPGATGSGSIVPPLVFHDTTRTIVQAGTPEVPGRAPDPKQDYQ